MMPEVPLSDEFRCHAVDLTMKPGWRYDPKRRLFVSTTGEEFAPWQQLPRATRIQHKVSSLALAGKRSLTAHERDLQRFLQIALPESADAQDYLGTVQNWPCVESAQLPPIVSLPELPH